MAQPKSLSGLDTVATVTSAIALNTDEKKTVEAIITKTVHGSVMFEYTVNPGVLGGVRVQVGDLVLDTTVASQLKKLKTALEQ